MACMMLLLAEKLTQEQPWDPHSIAAEDEDEMPEDCSAGTMMLYSAGLYRACMKSSLALHVPTYCFAAQHGDRIKPPPNKLLFICKA